MADIIIQGKVFTEEQVLEKGRVAIRRVTNFFRWFGLGLFLVGLLFIVVGIIDFDKGSDDSGVAGLILGIPPFIGGSIFFIISFVKRDPMVLGKQAFEKELNSPKQVNEAIDLLVYDKDICLCKKPLSKLMINSETKQFQLFTDNKYSKIYVPKDLIDYEIRVDNEIVVTSHTKGKKGAGRAIAGGLLFGGAGAVAGAMTGKSKSQTTSNQTEIHHYTLVVKVNDLSKPSFVIELDSVNIAEDVVSIFDILVGNINKFEKQEESSKSKHTLDKFEEIKKYKELLDEGIITQAEFEQKKKELL